MLPRTQTQRREALCKMISALEKHGFAKKKHVTSFWKPLASEMDGILTLKSDTAGAKAQQTQQKNVLKATVQQNLQQIIHAVKSNFPNKKEYDAELRRLGFQKERYKF